MTERLTNLDRKELIVGDRADDLSPEEAADLPLLAALLADKAMWADPSRGLERRVIQAIADEPTTAAVPNVVELHRRSHTRWRTRVMASAAAATVAIAAVVASVMAASGGSSPAFTANLAETGLVPGAHASAEIAHTSGGFRITLDASGLERQPDGSYYEAWLKNTDGTLVPIGTFSSSDEYITLWSGVSPETFTTLTVTMERSDNVQASSGHVVLRGEVRPG